MVKRAGRAFDPGGIPMTAPGSLAIPCRACPIPNINLPTGWQDVPAEKGWVFFTIVFMAQVWFNAVIQLDIHANRWHGRKFPPEE
jgi:hypothetical protein